VNRGGRSIVLIGMMGAGKSSVGRCLQWRIRVPLLDTDEIVASKFGMTIPEIFSRHGEEKFRQAETEALRNLPRTEQAIIVTGGGIVLRDENVDMLRELGVLIWLDGDEEALFKRASASGNRPLLQGTNSRKAFARILNRRLPLYRNIAHVRIDTSMLTYEEVAVAVLSKLRRFDHNRELGSARPATL
jgi:shikimate kinase